MSINFAKSWFVVDKGCTFAFFLDYIYVKKRYSVAFFIFCSKRYVDMMKT